MWQELPSIRGFAYLRRAHPSGAGDAPVAPSLYPRLEAAGSEWLPGQYLNTPSNRLHKKNNDVHYRYTAIHSTLLMRN